MAASLVAQAPVSMDIKLFESGEFADCKITCNGSEFQTHRLILSYRSQYFRKAFNGEWEESRTGEVKLNDYEPKKIEWLLRFIYHQDREWHRAEWQGQDSILPMLVELIDLGDYFLVDGLIDAAREAILDLCSSFAVDLRCRRPDEPTKGDGIVPSLDRFLDGIMKAITLTSATTGPTRPLRKFLVKFIIDVFACTPGISTWSHVDILAVRRQFRLATKLRDLVTRIPGLAYELNAALYQSAFPELRKKVSNRSWDSYVQDFTPENTCSACSCHLDGDEANEGLVFTDAYGRGRGTYCLRCGKDAFTSDWRNFMMDDGSRTPLLSEAPASIDHDLPDATA